jgi:cation diffusion facilitator CzcD-associated flavoprotein CzcO
MSSFVQDQVTAEERFARCLERLAERLVAGDAAAAAALFAEDGWWMDFLAFTWRYRTFHGRDEIGAALTRTLDETGARDFKIATGRLAPRTRRRSGVDVLEGFFDFTTRAGKGTGYLRMRPGDTPGEERIWILSTTLQTFGDGSVQEARQRHLVGDTGAPEPSGSSSPDPQVLIVGGGQGGLILAARLKQQGVHARVLERRARIGDNWRARYKSLVLHNESTTNTIPYMPFPETWPTFLHKDQIAFWLETYAQAMELDVWTGAGVTSATRDEATGMWTLKVDHSDGHQTDLRAPHLVMATGGHSGVPKIPNIPGIEDFEGSVFHSSEFSDGSLHRGKRVVVFGTGSSGHDISQNLVENGAASVTMFQRSPTAVISLVPCGTLLYAAYIDQASAADVDLIQSATPYPLLRETYQWLTKRTCDMDEELLAGLRKVGFRLDFEPDHTGFHMKYLRKGGGYYINVGASELIAAGTIRLEQTDNLAAVIPTGVQLKDQRVVEADVLILATGYHNQQEAVRQLVGHSIAEKVGPIWGFDQDHQMRNMWIRTAQEGFWIMGGALQEARIYSTYLAVQIKADLAGALPADTG